MLDLQKRLQEGYSEIEIEEEAEVEVKEKVDEETPEIKTPE